MFKFSYLAGSNQNAIFASKPGDFNVVVGFGKQDFIVVGAGSSFVYDNGYGTYVSAFNGNNTIIANGYGDFVAVGAGSNYVQANGAHDLIYVAGPQDPQYQKGARVDTLQANGDHDTITLGQARIDASVTGAHDNIYVTGTQLGSVLRLGDTSKVFLTPGSDLDLKLGVADTVQIGNALGDYAGLLKIEHLGTSVVELYQLTGLGSYADVQAHLTHVGGSWNLALPGDGQIDFASKPVSANFAFL